MQVRSLAPTLAFALLASPAFSDVLILEAPGLGAFRNPQTAIDLAPEGATLVFGADNIDGFTITGKSLTLVGTDHPDFVIEGRVIIRNLAAGQSVRAQGLRIRPATGSFGQFVSRTLIRDCEGAVRFSGCSIEGRPGFGDYYDFGPGERAFDIQNSPDVALLDCFIQGGEGGGDFNTFCCQGGDGGPGLTISGSEVALYDCTVEGGDGGTAGIWGGNGGIAVITTESRLFTSGCVLRGGTGGGADDIVAAAAGDGGDGLNAFGFPKPRLLATATLAGGGGFSTVGSNGGSGVDRSWDQGTLNIIPGAHRGLRAPQPIVVLGTDLSLDIEGLAGDRFFVAASMVDARNQSFAPLGVRLLPNPQLQTTTPQAVLANSGTTTITLPTPRVPAGQDQATWILQAFVVDGQGMKALSGAALVTSMRPDVGFDCNTNAVWDVVDALLGAVDCDGNLELDACQTMPDCNANGIADGLEIDCFGGTDNDNNGVLDICEGLVATVYVDPLAAPGGDGTFSAPYSNLHAAYSGLSGDGIIRLFDGLYQGPQNRGLGTHGIELTLESVNGAGNCTIDLENAGILVGSGFQTSAPLVTLRGLTVKNGISDNYGGAVQELFRPVLVEDCVFEGNSALRQGGAIALGAGSIVRRSTFVANATDPIAAFSSGGAIYSNPPLVVSDCVFDFNSSREGGAVSIDGDQCGFPSAVTHSVFRSNEASDNGGALHMGGCFSGTGGELLTIDNCFGALNVASKSGGFLYLGFGSGGITTRVTNCTLVKNQASQSTNNAMGGGAVWVGNERRLEILNSILWDNTAGAGPQIRSHTGTQLIVDHSNVVGGPGSIFSFGTVQFLPSSIDAVPGFMNQAGDYRLAAGSPCIDAGSVALLSMDVGDINSNGFLNEEVPIDILGAERRKDDPNAPDVGSGASPLPDMGAFER